ncbi:MAG: hypothetical protein ACR2P7_01140 [bacterium]
MTTLAVAVAVGLAVGLGVAATPVHAAAHADEYDDLLVKHSDILKNCRYNRYKNASHEFIESIGMYHGWLKLDKVAHPYKHTMVFLTATPSPKFNLNDHSPSAHSGAGAKSSALVLYGVARTSGDKTVYTCRTLEGNLTAMDRGDGGYEVLGFRVHTPFGWIEYDVDPLKIQRLGHAEFAVRPAQHTSRQHGHGRIKKFL